MKENEKIKKRYWHCRMCGKITPLEEAVCKGCGRDLGLWGEVVEKNTSGRPDSRPKTEPEPKPQSVDFLKIIKRAVMGIVAIIALCGLAVGGFKVYSQWEDQKNMAVAVTETATEAETETETEVASETGTETETEKEKETGKSALSQNSNKLMSDTYARNNESAAEEYSVFGSDYRRKEIGSITFLGSMDGVPNVWDLSEEQDGTVVGWMTNNSSTGLYDFFIATEGGVMAPADCQGMFYGYENVEHIEFNRCFNTENVINMGSMFSGCKSLSELDVRSFNTSNVTDMSYMFYGVDSSLNLSLRYNNTFDTSNVEEYECFMDDDFDWDWEKLFENEEETEFVNKTVVWSDPGMEKFVRAGIGKMEGEITTADLAEIQVIRISFGKIVMLKDMAEDLGELNYYNDYGEAAVSLENDHEEIQSLEDLRWFSSIRILQIEGEGERDVNDISVLANLKKLEELELCYFHHLEDISSLSGLKNLRKLNLSYNNDINDINPLKGLKNLQELYLAENQIENIEALANLKNLQKLSLGEEDTGPNCGNNVTDISPLADLENLTHLSLWANQVSDLSPLADLSKLTYLALGDNQISNIDPLSSLANLTILVLSENQISDVSTLSGLVNLMYLRLEDNQISDISMLADLVNLEELYLRNNLITEKDISDLKLFLPEVKIKD